MKVLSLFSGGGLGDFGLTLAGMEIVGQVEIDEYCQKILALRYPETHKWKDIREVTGDDVKKYCGAVDIVAGGFPCQPFSVAGKKQSKNDNRYLWPEMSRIISEVRPSWIIAENVPGIINLALDDVLHDLEGQGYETITLVFPAHAFGAPHRRDRIWIVANRDSGRGGSKFREQQDQRADKFGTGRQGIVANAAGNDDRCSAAGALPGQKSKSRNSRQQGHVADANKHNVQRQQQGEFNTEEREESCTRSLRSCSDGHKWWAFEPAVGRVAHGVPNRMDRLKLLGNGQVVHCVQWIGEKIMEFCDEGGNPC